MSLFLVSYPTPPTASRYIEISGEGHGGRVGGQGSLTGGSDTVLVCLLSGRAATQNVGSQTSLSPLESVFRGSSR